MTMRSIPLKTLNIRLPGQPEDAADIPFAYASNIIGVINAAAAERGLPLSEIQKMLRIIGPVEAAVARGDNAILLEDADWQHLNAIVAAFRSWRIVHACIPAFVQDIAEAECIASSGVVSAGS